MSLVFERKDIQPNFTRDVHNLLNKAGFLFKSGCFEGFTEHYSHDYKQMYFKYGAFSEVRGFWMNNYPEDDEFTLEIIIPEDDILEYDGNEVTGTALCRKRSWKA